MPFNVHHLSSVDLRPYPSCFFCPDNASLGGVGPYSLIVRQYLWRCALLPACSRSAALWGIVHVFPQSSGVWGKAPHRLASPLYEGEAHALPGFAVHPLRSPTGPALRMESAHRQAWRCYAGRLPRRWARFGYARKCPNLAAERCGASLGGSYMSPKGWEEWDEAFHRFDGWLRSAMSRIVLRRRHCGPCCEEGSNAKAMPGHFICWHGLVWGRLPRPCVTSFAVSGLRRLPGQGTGYCYGAVGHERTFPGHQEGAQRQALGIHQPGRLLMALLPPKDAHLQPHRLIVVYPSVFLNIGLVRGLAASYESIMAAR